jgi:hypothetical protein
LRAPLRDALTKAISAADIEAFMVGLGKLLDLQYPDLWPPVVRAVEHLDPPAQFRQKCLRLWMAHGDSFRSDVNNDLVLIKLLRVMLPKYTGPACTLFRGETMWSRRRRTYGMAWTADVGVAIDFANRWYRQSTGGSVVLKTHAPTDAIICAPGLIDNAYGEHEYVVDRRRLGRVEVVDPET